MFYEFEQSPASVAQQYGGQQQRMKAAKRPHVLPTLVSVLILVALFVAAMAFKLVLALQLLT